jgi:hypothetical protein
MTAPKKEQITNLPQAASLHHKVTFLGVVRI